LKQIQDLGIHALYIIKKRVRSFVRFVCSVFLFVGLLLW